ncbi:MAG: hypothetical protein D3914_09750 [Candidatus Electrothrix sp. LOE2]|nr:hypothetical protein [Candidatus Electrothrix sp. LOE2]
MHSGSRGTVRRALPGFTSFFPAARRSGWNLECFGEEGNKKYFTRYTGCRRGEPLCSPLHTGQDTGQAQGPAPTACAENGNLIF